MMKKFKIYSLSNFQICNTVLTMGFTGNSVVKNPPENAGDMGSIPGSRRSPGEGNPLQYSCLGNPPEEPGRLQSTGWQKNWTQPIN